MANEEPIVDVSPRKCTRWCASVLLAAIAALSTAIFPVAYFSSGFRGLTLAVTAAALCFATGLGSLVATHYFGRQRNPLLGLLASMAIRMVPALVACLVLALTQTAWRYEPFVYSLLVYYLAILGLETWLSVRLIKAFDSPSQGKSTHGV